VYQSEFSSILPNQQKSPIETYNDLQQQQLAQQRYQQELQFRKDAQLGELLGNLDLKHLGSGTIYDPIVQHNIDQSTPTVVDAYKKGGYIAALQQAHRIANEIGQYSGRARNIYAKLEESIKPYLKEGSGVSANVLRAAALHNAYFDKNTGAFKDPSLLSEADDYVSQVFDNPVDGLFTGMDPLNNTYKKIDEDTYNGERIDNKGLIKSTYKVTGQYRPQLYDPIDAKGNIVDAANKGQYAVGFRPKGEPVKVDGNPVVVNGQPLMKATDNAYNLIAGNRVNKGLLTQIARQKYPDVDIDEARKIVAYQYMDANKKHVTESLAGTDNSGLLRQQFQEQMQQERFAHADLMAERREANKEDVEVKDIYTPIATAVDNSVKSGKLGLRGTGLSVEQGNHVTKYIESQLSNAKGQSVQISNHDYYFKPIPGTKGRTGIYLTGPFADGLGLKEFVGEFTPDINYLANANDAKTVKAVSNHNNSLGNPQSTPAKNTTAPKTSTKRPPLDAFIKK
jgi:hypothetical protein